MSLTQKQKDLNALAPYLQLSKEVEEALQQGKAVVALESTIISHGFPYPENRENALRCEEEIRKQGAVPATIGILDGIIHVGLDADQVERLSTGKNISKCSRRDLSVVCAKKADGATTVAATMYICSLVGIRVFATGGIGGVHRGAEETMDISADLREFEQSPVAVICAGAKSILDIPKTLEVLETGGVPIIGYGTDELPAFYLRSSGEKLENRVDTPEEAAKILVAQWALGMPNGVLIANPIPEEAALNPDEIQPKIEEALREAKKDGISGKASTPYLLDKLYHITEGKSVGANKALAANNSKIAAQIAVALSACQNA